MPVNGVNNSPVYALGQANSGTKGSSGLEMNDYFKLLAAQLQNQSMHDTVDNSQYIAQLAQFSTMEMMNELNSTNKTSYAASLIGKAVGVQKENDLGYIEYDFGFVEQISFNGGVPNLYINGEFYSVDQISDIGKPDDTTMEQVLEQVKELNLTTQSSYANNLIGKQVEVAVGDEEALKIISGLVEDASVVNGENYITIQGVNYKLSDVRRIQNIVQPVSVSVIVEQPKEKKEDNITSEI